MVLVALSTAHADRFTLSDFITFSSKVGATAISFDQKDISGWLLVLIWRVPGNRQAAS